MKVLVVGGGGREHALVWKLKQSKRVEKIYCAPGNGGIAADAECVDIKADEVDQLVVFAAKEKIDMVVVAPDGPLALGLVDKLEEVGIRAFGPRALAAKIEYSKAFSKKLMEKYEIPTSWYEVFSDYITALSYIKRKGFPLVIKADGLSLGKGVII